MKSRYETIDLRPKPRKAKRKSDRQENASQAIAMTRRDFLLGAAMVVGGVAGMGLVKGKEKIDKLMGPVEKIVTRSEEVKKSEIQTNGELKKEMMEDNGAPTLEQEYIDEEDARSINEIINYDKEGKLDFNAETVNSIKAHCKKRYREEPKMRDSFKEAYRQMGTWLPELKKIFREVGIPEKYVYLAIPESHWDLSARSEKGATGPYQFTRPTANLKVCYLKRDIYIDERNDPLKSARACAKLLKDNYQKCGHDWDLALSAYNGSYVWEYLKIAKADKRKDKPPISYSNYQIFAEKKINDIRDTMKYGSSYTHKAFRGERIIDIAKNYGISVKQIMDANRMKRMEPTYDGQLLRIPISDKNRLVGYKFVMKGFSENLLYPAKFNAVMELIDERFVTEQLPPYYPKFVPAPGGVKEHVVKQKETLYSLAKAYKIDQKQILKVNPQIGRGGLKVNDRINIPGKNLKELTLPQIANTIGVSAARLMDLNPELRERMGKNQKPVKKKGKIIKMAENIYVPAGYNLRT